MLASILIIILTFPCHAHQSFQLYFSFTLDGSPSSHEFFIPGSGLREQQWLSIITALKLLPRSGIRHLCSHPLAQVSEIAAHCGAGHVVPTG